VVTTTDVTLVVLVGAVGDVGAIKARGVITKADITQVKLLTGEGNLDEGERGGEQVLTDSGIKSRAHEALHEQSPRFLAGRGKRSTPQLTEGSHVRNGPLEVGGRGGREKVIDGRPVLPIKLGATEEARRKVDSSCLLVLVDAKAQGEVEQLGVGNTNRASKLRHSSTCISGGTDGLPGGHTNDKVKWHNKVRDNRRKNVGYIQVKVDGKRNALATS
jgi:hypothetical protein